MKNHNERLEIFTANRRPLEEAFGVDLIYYNKTRQNIIMVQYKMLERDNNNYWIYRPDAKLASQIVKMKSFSNSHPLSPHEYRLNTQVFYLKFVKRDGLMRNSSIIMPIEHFERLQTDPSCKGPHGAFRINFESVAGRHLRQDPFLDLIRSGYIGATMETTTHFKKLVDCVIKNGRAVVAAIQSSTLQR